MITPYFQLFAYDPNQSYLRRTSKRRSRSFVQGFLKLHFTLLNGTGTTISITDVDGNNLAVTTGQEMNHSLLSTSPGRGGFGMLINPGGADSSSIIASSSTNNGIVAGTGTTAVTPTDYQLATLIADGTTASTLEYFTCAGTNFSTVGSTASFDLERLFRNSSGGTITINETGVYSAYSRNTSGGQFTHIRHFCTIRDIVSPGFAVLNGEYLRVVYTLSVTA